MKWIQILTAFKLYCNLLMCQNITIFVVIWLCFLSLNFCWGGAKTSPIFNIWYRISHGIHELHVWRDIWNLKPICLILFKLFEIDAFIFGRISIGHVGPCIINLAMSSFIKKRFTLPRLNAIISFATSTYKGVSEYVSFRKLFLQILDAS